MFRYSIIHHDVRDQFELTLAEYLVCDALHQLQHTDAKKPNTQIAKFIGVDEWSVRNAKKTLKLKGLVAENNKEFKTTKKWAMAITYAKQGIDTRENPEKTRENPELDSGKSRHSIINSNKEINDSADAEKIDSHIEKTDQDGNTIEKRIPKSQQLKPSVIGVFGLFEGNPARGLWRAQPAQREAAKTLLEKYGIERTKEFYLASQKYKDDPLAPQVNSPFDLLNKLARLRDYEKRRNQETN